jgi:cyclopropane fatty-acyl-phospholipid synthase-like methyltransferase
VDRDRISAITHGDRAFHNPLDPARVAEALDTLRLGPGDRVLDAGCGAGWGGCGTPSRRVGPS